MLNDLANEITRIAARPATVRPASASDRSGGDQVRSPRAEPAEARKSASEPAAEVDRNRTTVAIEDALGQDFPANASLQIDVSEETGGFVYKAVDRESGEVIKQFPPEEVLERLERKHKAQGLALDTAV